MISWLIFIACLVWYAFGMYSDISVSRLYVFYGKDEDNKWVLDERGQLSMKKVWIVPAIEVAAATIFGVLGHALSSDEQWGNIGLLVAGMTLAGAGIAHFAISKKNAGHARKNRIAQIAKRANWKANGIPESFTTHSRNGYVWHRPFAWIYAGTLTALTAALTEWLALADDDPRVWPDKTFHPEEK